MAKIALKPTSLSSKNELNKSQMWKNPTRVVEFPSSGVSFLKGSQSAMALKYIANLRKEMSNFLFKNHAHIIRCTWLGHGIIETEPTPRGSYRHECNEISNKELS